MPELAQPIVRLIDEFAKLPGIGRKSAERLAYYVLRVKTEEALALSDAIRDVKLNVHQCKNCYNLSEEDYCPICQDKSRNERQICVVEQPQDLIALENTGVYHGLYHVLQGRLSPLDKTGPEDLTIAPLIQRVERLIKQSSPNDPEVELIMATNPTVEGDATAGHIVNLLNGKKVKISRLARGIALGAMVEFTNREVLSDAFNERRIVE